MRSPLSRLVAGLLLISGTGLAARADANPAVQADAYGADVYGVEMPKGQVLPSTDLTLPGGVSPTSAASTPAAPAVQAIPTPTAFQAGVGLLAATFVLRRFRRRSAERV